MPTSVAYDLFGEAPLPPDGDWRMHSFPHRKDKIEILELFSPSDEDGSFYGDDSGSFGSQAHVFKVRIGSHGPFALKVFKFYTVRLLRAIKAPFTNRRVNDATMVFQSDPFFAECRAYSRISMIEQELTAKRKPTTRQGPKIAVPCLGYPGMAAAEFQDIFARFGATHWNRDASDQLKEAPFRALVKELVEGKRAVFNPPKMLRDLNLMRASGIYAMDVHARNYLGGLLVDFRLSWTQPHWVLEHTGQRGLEIYKLWICIVSIIWLKQRARAQSLGLSATATLFGN